MDICADSIAASMAGKASSPLTSGCTRLPAVQRFGDNRLTTREQFQVLRAFMLRLFQVFENWTAGGFVHAEYQRAAADAVDSQHEVEQRASAGINQMSNPKRCGAAVTFVEQGVAEASSAANRWKPTARCGQN